MSTQDAFRHIYGTNAWGGSAGTIFSGRGSTHPGIVEPYIQAVLQFLHTLPMEERRIVDLGCGDFRVGERIVPSCLSYVGVDIVPEVIHTLEARGFSGNVSFRVGNIVTDELPEGRICIIRQVLQHLSNQEIAAVLLKLKQYRYVILTEHFPSPGQPLVPNIDKAHGPHIRLELDSAVCLDAPPFNVPKSAMTLLVEVPGDGKGQDLTAGVIRTFLLDTSVLNASDNNKALSAAHEFC